tara:strand:+ start:744 stop:1400 length:657 start_codon:yes stop_codon:yes gene_type:complete
MKEIAIFGATGLIGSNIISFLENDIDYQRVRVITRRPLVLNTKKFKNIVVDFNSYKSIKNSIEGCSIVFVSIGTTQSKVNWNLKKYRKIDFKIPIDIGKACKENNIKKFLIVSSAGANINAKGFYLSLKGEIEKEIIKLDIQNTYIFRPSLLIGKRNELRFGEKIAQIIMPIFSFLFPDNYKPIKASDVAKSMINISKKNTNNIKFYHFNEITNSLYG